MMCGGESPRHASATGALAPRSTSVAPPQFQSCDQPRSRAEPNAKPVPSQPFRVLPCGANGGRLWVVGLLRVGHQHPVAAYHGVQRNRAEEEDR
jgi:hypothetical protein